MNGAAKLAGVLALAVVGAMTVPATPAAQNAATQAGQGNGPTFTKDVLPILQRSCQQCHRPGTFAPMSLVTYQEVRPWVRSIRQKVTARVMPPWHIDRSIGEYLEDPSLSDEEIATITTWIDNGAPQGNPAEAPAPRQFADADAWTYGAPDLIVSM